MLILISRLELMTIIISFILITRNVDVISISCELTSDTIKSPQLNYFKQIFQLWFQTGSLSQSGSYHSGSLGTGSDLPRLDSPCRGGSVSAFAYRGTSFSTGGHDSFRSEHSNEGLPANRLTVALHNVALCVDQIYGYFAQLHNFEKQVLILKSEIGHLTSGRTLNPGSSNGFSDIVS